MQVQYVVALCCQLRNPDAVDVTIGDHVQDIATEKPRDVDITITIKEPDGVIRAFKGFEVKREAQPLDVVAVEQLCVKFKDMSAITHRAIVSASGYTAGAIKKAAAHDVVLYHLKHWEKPLKEQFPAFTDVGKPEEFLAGFTSTLLCWTASHRKFYFKLDGGPSSFDWKDDTSVFSSDGKAHPKFPSMRSFQDFLLMESTNALFALEPIETIRRSFPLMLAHEGADYTCTPAWPHSHTLDVWEHGVCLKFGRKIHRGLSMTISGYLQWQRRQRIPDFEIMEQVPSGEVFAAAAVADYGSNDGRMFAILLQPDSRLLKVHQFQLMARHANMIRKLQLVSPEN